MLYRISHLSLIPCILYRVDPPLPKKMTACILFSDTYHTFVCIPIYMAKKKHVFSKSFLSQIEEALEKEKKQLEGELSKFAKKNPHTKDDFDASFPEYGNELEDNAREIAEYTTNKPLEITLEKALRDVGKAIKHLRDSTYGICKYCDEPISEKRLLARPTSSSCVSCKKTITDEV